MNASRVAENYVNLHADISKKEMMRKIAPSILASDFGNLQRDIEMLNESEADFIHCDIMDGVFVPNISFGFPVLKHVQKYARKPMDVHLMIQNPDQYIDDFKAHGAENITVHYETCPHLHRTIQKIRDVGIQASVTINPHNPVSLLEDIICDVDMVLLMSVNPGYGGQKFIENTYERVQSLKELIIRKHSKALIQVDGGVDTGNVAKLSAAGVDVFVAGSFVFKAEDPKDVIRQLKYQE